MPVMGCLQVDSMMCSTGIDVENSGSTAVMALVDETASTVTTAWVGDSRAVVGSRAQDGGGWTARELTR
jgi:serine/threonine protein phosphatase PrpC